MKRRSTAGQVFRVLIFAASVVPHVVSICKVKRYGVSEICSPGRGTGSLIFVQWHSAFCQVTVVILNYDLWKISFLFARLRELYITDSMEIIHC